MTTETAERPMPSLLYDDEQEALRAVVRDIVEDLAPWTEVVKGLDQVRPYDDRLWRQLAQAGVAGLLDTGGVRRLGGRRSRNGRSS